MIVKCPTPARASRPETHAQSRRNQQSRLAPCQGAAVLPVRSREKAPGASIDPQISCHIYYRCLKPKGFMRLVAGSLQCSKKLACNLGPICCHRITQSDLKLSGLDCRDADQCA